MYKMSFFLTAGVLCLDMVALDVLPCFCSCCITERNISRIQEKRDMAIISLSGKSDCLS